jgi:hypothetical protein
MATTRVSNANMMTFGEKLSRFSLALFIPMCVVLLFSVVVDLQSATVNIGI